jgi:hypothetical protein
VVVIHDSCLAHVRLLCVTPQRPKPLSKSSLSDPALTNARLDKPNLSLSLARRPSPKKVEPSEVGIPIPKKPPEEARVDFLMCRSMSLTWKGWTFAARWLTELKYLGDRPVILAGSDRGNIS